MGCSQSVKPRVQLAGGCMKAANYNEEELYLRLLQEKQKKLAKEFDDQQQDKSEGNTTQMIKRQDVNSSLLTYDPHSKQIRLVFSNDLNQSRLFTNATSKS